MDSEIEVFNRFQRDRSLARQDLSVRSILSTYQADLHLLNLGGSFSETLYPSSYVYDVHPVL